MELSRTSDPQQILSLEVARVGMPLANGKASVLVEPARFFEVYNVDLHPKEMKSLGE